MKKIFLITILAAPCVLAQADPFAAATKNTDKKLETPAKENIFIVSKTNESTATKEQFMKLWDALRNPRFTADTKKMFFKVRQAAGKDGDLSRYLAVQSGSTDYFAILIKQADLIDGQVYSGWFRPVDFYEYTSTTAATRRVAQYREAVAEPDANAPSKEEFVAKLKAGETFTVTYLAENKPCKPCFGRGKLGSLQGGGECEECKGKGTKDELETWTLKW